MDIQLAQTQDNLSRGIVNRSGAADLIPNTVSINVFFQLERIMLAIYGFHSNNEFFEKKCIKKTAISSHVVFL